MYCSLSNCKRKYFAPGLNSLIVTVMNILVGPSLCDVTEQPQSILLDKGQKARAFQNVCYESYSDHTHMHLYKHTTCLQEAVSHVSS